MFQLYKLQLFHVHFKKPFSVIISTWNCKVQDGSKLVLSSVVKYHIDIEKILIYFDMIYIELISISILKFRYISKKYRYRFWSFDIYRKNIYIDFEVSIYIEKYRYWFWSFDIYQYFFDISKKILIYRTKSINSVLKNQKMFMLIFYHFFLKQKSLFLRFKK